MIPSSDLVFYVQLHVKPEYVQDWKDAVMEAIDHMSKETTFVTCYLHQDAEDANRFTLYERWNEPTVEAFVKNQMDAKLYRKSYEEKLPAMLQSPRTVSVLHYIKEWHRE
jgi:quinol monooxygenase YgiN